jgi:hypothetical protein
MSIRYWQSVVVVGAVAMAACGFSPTAPFEGFDGKGTRLTGSFAGTVSAQSGEPAAAAASYQGLSVYLAERPSLGATVAADGRFTLEGLPSGAWTLVFTRDGRVVGQIRFSSVRRNQGITIVVVLTDAGEVVLTSEARDQVSFEGECPRGAGFWCQNQGGQNPNLSAEEFREFSTEAASLLAAVPALDSAEDVALAVCQTGDQLLRQLATLGLNLASSTISRGEALVNEPGYSSVGAAFDAAVALADGSASSQQERNQVKDVLERINENQNTAVCENNEEDDDSDGDDDAPASGKMTICHIPPGNPNARHTLEIDASAWPAHRAHGDKEGGC